MTITMNCYGQHNLYSDDAYKTKRKEAFLRSVNNYRQSGCNCGSKYFPLAPPVKWNDLLEEAAKNHTIDMITNVFFNHTGSDGKNPGDRIRKVGYDRGFYGENIIYGSLYSPDNMVESWINSQGHCMNIMNSTFDEMGVFVKNGYATQVFGAKKKTKKE